jgi:hypothetical protein
MKRIVLVLTVAAMVAAMLVGSAAPVQAQPCIHCPQITGLGCEQVKSTEAAELNPAFSVNFIGGCVIRASDAPFGPPA